MKLPDPVYTVEDWINPKGNLARDYVRVGKHAQWLTHLCSLWLSYHNEDNEHAKYTIPHELPKDIHPDAKRINEAIKNCGMWGPSTRKTETDQPEPGKVTPWWQVFEQWESGSLDRQIAAIIEAVPAVNGEAIVNEIAK